MATKHILGSLLLVILSASVYFVLSDEYRIDIKETYSSFKVYENGSWELAGEERSILYDGSKKMRANNRVVNFTIEDNITTAYRYAYFKNNITVIDTYVFNGSTDDVEMFPVEHKIEVLNAKRERPYILVYEVSKLEYFGETDYAIGSAHEFGHNMKVEWSDGNYYERLYKYKDKNEGKLEIKYRVTSDNFSVQTRLFDPIIDADSVFTNLIYNEADIDKGTAIYEIKNPVDNLSVDDIYYTYDLVKGSGLKSIEAYVEVSNSVQIPTYNYSLNQYSCDTFNNVTQENQTGTCNETIKTQNGTIEVITISWEQIDYLDKGYHKIKVIGYFETIGENSLDWFPNIVLDKNKYELPKDKFGQVSTLDFKQPKWAWWNTNWTHYKEYTNLTGNITYMFIGAAASDDADFNETRFLSCYNDTLVFNHTLEATFGTSGQFRVNNLGENCTRRYYNNSAASSTSSASDVYYGPKSVYYFDANPNDFVGSNDGTNNGATLSSGYINGSYDFDGSSDYINLGNSFDFSSGITLHSWYNPDVGTGNRDIFSKYDGSTDDWTIYQSNDNIIFSWFVGGANFQAQWTNTGDIENMEWIHVAATFDNANGKIYINGDLKDTTAKVGAMTTSSDNIFVGKRVSGGNLVNGGIDEPYIYEYAITQDQVTRFYTQTEPIFIEGAEQNQTPVDTCTYTSGDWDIDCNDNCTITSNVNLGGNDMVFSNSGVFWLSANITNYANLNLSSGCDFVFGDNTQLIS